MAFLGGNSNELACVYAALILHDDGLEVSSDNISSILKAAGIEVEAYWPPPLPLESAPPAQVVTQNISLCSSRAYRHVVDGVTFRDQHACTLSEQPVGSSGSGDKCTRQYHVGYLHLVVPNVALEAVRAVSLHLKVMKSKNDGLDVVLHGLGERGADFTEALALQADPDYFVGETDPTPGVTPLGLMLQAGAIKDEEVSKEAPALVAFSSPQLTDYVKAHRGKLVALRLTGTDAYGCDTHCDHDCKLRKYSFDAEGSQLRVELTVGASPSPSPSPRSAPLPPPAPLLPPLPSIPSSWEACSLPADFEGKCVITSGWARVASARHECGFLIGQTLTDVTVNDQSAVTGPSVLGSLDPNANFVFSGGLTVLDGLPFPIDWLQLQELASRIVNSTTDGSKVVVIDQGSDETDADVKVRYDMEMLFPNVVDRAPGRSLAVFTGTNTVVIRRSESGVDFTASVLAPSALVAVESYDTRVIDVFDGFIAALAYNSWGSQAASVDFLGHSYQGALYCRQG